MKAYKGSFKKQDGSVRTMRFLTLKDLPDTIINSKIKGTNQKHSLREGMELVWDIDEEDLRIFNHTTVLDKIEEFDYTFNQ